MMGYTVLTKIEEKKRSFKNSNMAIFLKRFFLFYYHPLLATFLQIRAIKKHLIKLSTTFFLQLNASDTIQMLQICAKMLIFVFRWKFICNEDHYQDHSS